jgi:hypothetical protein
VNSTPDEAYSDCTVLQRNVNVIEVRTTGDHKRYKFCSGLMDVMNKQPGLCRREVQEEDR